jgi:hypothetical protein
VSILAICNLTDGSWSFSGEPDFYSVQIQVGFTHDAEGPVLFNRLSFGWSAAVSKGDGAEVSHPLPGQSYLQSDQQYLVTDMAEFSPDANVVLSIWAENADKRYETEFSFVMPRPPQPFDDWIWSEQDEAWIAPVPMPLDGIEYYWDTNTSSWQPMITFDDSGYVVE